LTRHTPILNPAIHDLDHTRTPRYRGGHPLILVRPQLLNYIVAVYLIAIGVIGIL
jgi:hypothetical protein